VRPPEGLSTPAVFKQCRPADSPRGLTPVLAALRGGNLRRLAASMFNRLEEAAERVSPWIGRLRSELRRLDCACAQMSGSGSSYFAICHHALHARRVAAQLRMRGVGQVYCVAG
jgi:4-diphosphocytidyl-2-C-methyl-D-erythritol kinase